MYFRVGTIFLYHHDIFIRPILIWRGQQKQKQKVPQWEKPYTCMMVL